MWSLLVACSASIPEPPPAPAPAPGDAAPTVQTLLGEAKGIHFLGDWTSAPCGGRGYARNLRFEEDGTYAGVDLVSPCPPDVACAWSGLLGFTGVWKQEGEKLHLREIGGGVEQGAAHPTEFTANVEGQLLENGCVYTVGLTVPAGYTEERVRPKVPTK